MTIVLPDMQRSRDSDLIHANGSVPFAADQSMASHKLTNVTDPTSDQDAATKKYVDDAIAANGDGNVNGPGSSIDKQLVSFNGTDGDAIQGIPNVSHDADGRITGPGFIPEMVSVADASTITLDWSDGSLFEYTLGGDRTIAFSNFVINQAITIHQYQDGTGSRVPVLPGAIIWPGTGAEPEWSAAAGHLDIWGVRCLVAGGSPVFAGFFYGGNYNV